MRAVLGEGRAKAEGEEGDVTWDLLLRQMCWFCGKGGCNAWLWKLSGGLVGCHTGCLVKH